MDHSRIPPPLEKEPRRIWLKDKINRSLSKKTKYSPKDVAEYVDTYDSNTGPGDEAKKRPADKTGVRWYR